MDGLHSELVRVKIYDREYTLRTSGDPGQLHRLCLLLDRRMREVVASTGAVDTLKVAILAALSIADELERATEEMRSLDESLSRRSLECVSLLERFLHQNAGAQGSPTAHPSSSASR
jgi:cell division protein ZapA